MDPDLDHVWKALADGTRRSLLDGLRDGPRTTGDLAAGFPGLTRFAVMKHLRVLESCGLVVARKRGRERWNALNAVPLRAVYERWVSAYEDQWAGSLLGLKELAEAPAEREREMGTKLLQEPARLAVIETRIDIAAPRARVFELFTSRIADWFYESEAARSSRSAHFEPVLGGKFFMRDVGGEKDGDENLLAEVTCIRPGRLIRMRGDFTMPQAMIANVTVRFEDTDEGSSIDIDHRMMGEFDDDLPAGFEEGWLDGLQKLKARAESEG